MKKILFLSICATLFLAAAIFTHAQAPGGGQPRRAWVSNLTLTTTAFPDGGEIPAQYAASRNSTTPNSPKLQWSNPPEGTVSYALIFHDPDAHINKTHEDYLHWLVFNIPASVNELPEGMPPTVQLPDGTIQAKTRGTTVGYIGPGAPPGPFHHYTFDLYALDTKLDLGPEATREQVMTAMTGHIVGKAILIGRYRRSAPPTEQK